jgi:hypothetical protein
MRLQPKRELRPRLTPRLQAAHCGAGRFVVCRGLVMNYPGPPGPTNCGSQDFHDWHGKLVPQPFDHALRRGDPTAIICEGTRAPKARWISPGFGCRSWRHLCGPVAAGHSDVSHRRRPAPSADHRLLAVGRRAQSTGPGHRCEHSTRRRQRLPSSPACHRPGNSGHPENRRPGGGTFASQIMQRGSSSCNTAS